MNVSGLTSSTSAPRATCATSASMPRGADSHSARCRSASRSTTSKPTLCRVPAYSRPGFPRPTINFIAGRALIRHARELQALLLFFLRRSCPS